MKTILTLILATVSTVLAYAQCPAKFNVTGGGTYTPGSVLNVTLSGSEVGVTYTLGGPSSSMTLAGTGGPLRWENISIAGQYNVSAYRSGCSSVSMNGHAMIVNPTASVKIWGSDQPLAGHEVEYTLIFLDGAGNSYHYEFGAVDTWSISESTGYEITGTLDDGISVRWTQAGTYHLHCDVQTTTNGHFQGDLTVADYANEPASAVFSGPTVVTVGEPAAFAAALLGADGQPAGTPGFGLTYTYYDGNVCDLVEDSPTDASLIFCTPGTHTVQYHLSCSADGSNWYDISSNVLTVTVIVPVPVSTFTITQNCDNTVVTRNAPLFAGASYEWYWQTSPNGTDLSLGSGHRITRNSAGPLYLRSRLKESPNTWSDASLSVGNITVLSPPAQFTVDGGGLYCGTGSGVPITLSGSQTGVNYQLLRNGSAVGPVVAGTGNALTWPAQTGLGTYTVAASIGNCVRPMLESALVEPPPPNFLARVVATGPAQFCEGGSVELLAYEEEGYVFQWQKDQADIPSEVTAQYIATQPGSYRVVLRVTEACHVYSNAIVVQTSPEPGSSFTTSGPTTFCAGESTTFTGATGTDFTYQWQKDGVSIAGAVNSSYTATAAGNYTLMTTHAGCSSLSAGAQITVNPRPVAHIEASGATSICAGESVALIATAEATSYQWKRGGSVIAGETSRTTTVSAAGVYRVVASNGLCTAESNPVSVVVKPIPDPITSISGPATIPAGDKLWYSVVGGSGADEFLWNTPPATNITYQNVQRSSAIVGFNHLEEKIISVSVQKDGCESAPVEKIIQVTEDVVSIPSVIPAALKVAPDRQLLPPLVSRVFALNTLSVNEIRDVFQAPPCLDGEYYVGFQLSYDLADQNTTANWIGQLDITFQQGPNTILWTRPLQVDMATQTFVSTIFHDAVISCGGDYRFKIHSKITNGGGVQAPEQNVYLKVLLYKKLNDVFTPPANLLLNYALAGNFLQLSWTYEGKAAMAYDIEWVHIDDHENFSGTAQQAFSFKEPVRITTAEHSYKHHAHYPVGRIWFRARAVGYDPRYPKHRIPGNWFYGSGSPLVIANPQEDKSWQMQTVFAEEGKYKKVLSYYDGTLRQRQVQTNLSSEEMTLVGETLYDFEGRKSVDILPVPTTDLSLAYKEGFNTFASADPAVAARTTETRKKFHYDNRQLINSVLSQTAGAGKYYSENNLVGTPPQPLKDYVPDADGYVYSQVEYLNDGTGRVGRQSGVGEMFRMDGGHTTRYYYAEASRIELVRLFGPNVGNPSHYKKNVVVDANKQVSVSYVDQAGKVIATALAGAPPANVEALPGYAANAPDLTVDLASKNTRADGVSRTIHKFLNEAPNTTYRFTYDLSAVGATIPDLACQACTYDLTISISDPDGKLIDLSAIAGNESGGASIYQRKNLTAANCSAPSPLSNVVIDVVLAEIGDYTLTKTLTPHELTLEQIKSTVQLIPAVQAQIAIINDSYTPDPQDCAICTSCTGADAAIDEAINEIAELDCDNIYQEIVRKLKQGHPANPGYEPADEEIRAHALYCKYELCQKEKSSAIFEKQMARVDRWSIATDADHLYQNIDTLSLTKDPFFTAEESPGYPYAATMQGKINTIGIKGTSYTGSLSQVTDPANTNYYINVNGEPDPAGYHILYFDLMRRRASLGATAYGQELDKQRWILFMNLYVELKRQVKLLIPEYQGCPAALAELQMSDNFPGGTNDMTASGNAITAWGQSHGVYVPVSDAELEMHLANITATCGVTLSGAHQATITSHLRNYFNADVKKNFFKMILIEDLTGSHLDAVQSVLDAYSCSLELVAVQNPVICVKEAIQPDPAYPLPPLQPQAFRQNGISGLTEKSGLPSAEDSRHLIWEKHNAKIENRFSVERSTQNDVSEMNAPCSSIPSQPEYDALVALYNSTNGANWTLQHDLIPGNDWKPIPGVPQDVRYWHNVKVDCAGHVTELTLFGNNLVGTLPPELSSLIYLERLILSGNELSGPIPVGIGNLSSLKELVLSGNDLSGTIPVQLSNCTQLKKLWLQHNWFSGSIHPAFGNLTALEDLLLSDNQLTGTIPAELGNLTQLNAFHAHNNHLSGSIPSSLGELESLVSLDLGQNQLSGPIPATLGNLTHLTSLSLGLNELSGSIPPSLGNLTLLERLDLGENQLSGPIPTALGNLTHLTSLLLHRNQLSGSIPSSLGNLASLKSLLLFHNQLSGMIPPELGSLSELRVLAILNNQLSGSLPIQNLTHLEQLYFYTNKFTFSDILPVKNQLSHLSSANLDYTPQGFVDDEKILGAPIGSPVILSTGIDRNTNPASLFQWFKGSVAITPQSQSAHTYTIPSMSPSDVGWYHYTITNPDVPDLVLTSWPQGVVVGVPVCTGYAPVSTFTVTPDWAQLIQKCMDDAEAERTILIDYAVEKYLEEQVSLYNNAYQANCLNSATEQLQYSYSPKEYHYTLYYYDQAGNLVQTVPPAGVNPLPNAQAALANPPQPAHTLVTRYQYSSVNQLVVQHTPDAGKSEFLYDKKGQLRLSRNAQQAIDHKYSYTKYDQHGRITEVGELEAAVELITIAQHIDDPRFPTTGVVQLPTYPLADITRTHYDRPNESTIRKMVQQNLRGRVAWVEVTDQNGPDRSVTAYSYDPHGNVRSLLQKIPGLDYRRTDYVYDLVSGKVNYVFFQHGKADQLIHQYTYDADNRIRTASTSSDAYLWNLEASYQYYAHGPLARTELGNYRVQGQDYYYTLQGWIKGVNMPFAGDPGADGSNPSRVGKDVYAYTLGYYEHDYKASNASAVLSDTRDQQWARYNTLMGNYGLYNGNIAWMVTDLLKIGEVSSDPAKSMQAMLYQYDQLNRIKQSLSLAHYTPGSGFGSRTAAPAPYDEAYSYDGNGNILTLKRNDASAALTDDFNYQYYANTNKLRYLNPLAEDLAITSGAVASDPGIYRNITLSGTAYAAAGAPAELAGDDITIGPDFQSDPGADLTLRPIDDDEGHYMYDKIGNLVKDDEQEVIISWTPYGKVREVRKYDNSVITTFRYDAAGNRVYKRVVKPGSTKETHYVRDATGNVMAVYSDTLVVERPIYGSSRLGQYKGGVAEAHLTLGKRHYELSNHLGNVLAVITDNVGMQGGNVWAKVINTTDYYAFGLEMSGRTFTDEAAYRYGFNGKEGDKEEFGSTTYDYGFRIYNPSIGRFLSVDPLTNTFPWLTPYQFASNRPIIAIDLDGLESDDQCGEIIEPNIPKKTNEAFLLPTHSITKKVAEEGVKKAVGRTILQSILRGAGWVLNLATVMQGDGHQPTEEDYEKQEIEYYEMRLEKDGSLSEGEENRYLDLIAKHNKEFFIKKELKGSDLVKIGPDQKNFDPFKDLIKDADYAEFTQGTGDKAKRIKTPIPAGYEKVSGTSHGQSVFSNGKDYISPDTDGHNGGIWKKARTLRALGSKETRDGTYDKDLNRIGN